MLKVIRPLTWGKNSTIFSKLGEASVPTGVKIFKNSDDAGSADRGAKSRPESEEEKEIRTIPSSHN